MQRLQTLCRPRTPRLVVRQLQTRKMPSTISQLDLPNAGVVTLPRGFPQSTVVSGTTRDNSNLSTAMAAGTASSDGVSGAEGEQKLPLPTKISLVWLVQRHLCCCYFTESKTVEVSITPQTLSGANFSRLLLHKLFAEKWLDPASAGQGQVRIFRAGERNNLITDDSVVALRAGDCFCLQFS